MSGEVQISREQADALVELLAGGAEHDKQMQAKGAKQATSGWERGFNLGHDTGIGARQDTREFVHGLMAGFAAGTKERQQLAQELLDRHRPVRREPEHDPGIEIGS